jgi:hypothetical protein
LKVDVEIDLQRHTTDSELQPSYFYAYAALVVLPVPVLPQQAEQVAKTPSNGSPLCPLLRVDTQAQMTTSHYLQMTEASKIIWILQSTVLAPPLLPRLGPYIQLNYFDSSEKELHPTAIAPMMLAYAKPIRHWKNRSSTREDSGAHVDNKK